MISFVISSYNKPLQLITCITSLMIQKGPNEIIVADNSDIPTMKDTIIRFTDNMPGVIYMDTSKDCSPDINAGYKAQNIAALVQAKGDWLCFPSEDCYYVPGFAEVMLGAATENGWDFVYCDFIFDPRYNCYASKGTYSVVQSYPRFRFMDKSNFIVRRKLFKGFEFEEHGYGDYLLCESLLKKGVEHGHAPGVLMVHN